MSTSLYWEPVPEESFLGKDLKYKIAPLVWKHDGSLGGERVLVDKSTVFYDEDDNAVNLYQFLGKILANDMASKEALRLYELINNLGAVYITLKD